MLLEHNADVEARDEDNSTPLHGATSRNSTEVAELLLTYNAKIEARDKDNETPFDSACSSWRNNTGVKRLLMERALNISKKLS